MISHSGQAATNLAFYAEEQPAALLTAAATWKRRELLPGHLPLTAFTKGVSPLHPDPKGAELRVVAPHPPPSPGCGWGKPGRKGLAFHVGLPSEATRPATGADVFAGRAGAARIWLTDCVIEEVLRCLDFWRDYPKKYNMKLVSISTWWRRV